MRRLEPKVYMRRFLADGVRVDGREPEALRPASAKRGVLRRCAGSAVVQLGETKAIGGLSLQVGHPAESSPQSGDIDVDVSLSPLCGAAYRVGRKSAAALQLEALLKKVLTASGFVDYAGLCIAEGAAAWKLLLSITCVSDAGNLWDAVLRVAVETLRDAVLPAIEMEDGEAVIVEGEGRPLPLQGRLVPLTCGLFDGTVLVDPSLEEKNYVDAEVTVVCNGEGKVCAVYKDAGAPMAPAQIARCIALCEELAAQEANGDTA